jgi:hypothetical protein
MSQLHKLLEQHAVFVHVNEQGTPLLYFPDDGQSDGTGCREATAGEWHLWRKLERLLNIEEAARRAVEYAEEIERGTPKQTDAHVCAQHIQRELRAALDANKEATDG